MSAPLDHSTSDDWGDPSRAIIEAVAAREGVDVTDIEPPAYEPLFTAINPEALDRLFRNPAEMATARVVLEYEGYEVVVHGDGRVEVSDPSFDPDGVGHPIED